MDARQFWMVAALAAAALFPSLEVSPASARVTFEKALALEEVQGKPAEALKLYEELVAQSSDSALAAQAQYRIGVCQEKMGRGQAQKAYQAVLDRFPGQSEAVRLARSALARLASGVPQSPSMTVREFMHSVNWPPGEVADPTIDALEFQVTSDGRTFVYPDWTTGDLAVMDLATGKKRGLYGVDWRRSEEYFHTVAISPDNQRIALLNYNYSQTSAGRDLARIGVDSIDGGQLKYILEQKGGYFSVQDWSPDGRYLLIVRDTPNHVVTLGRLDVASGELSNIAPLNAEYPRRADISPDGRLIAYDAARDGERKIYLWSAGKESVLVDSAGEDDSPLWTPDGRHLLFRSNRTGTWDLYALSVEKGQARGSAVLIKANLGHASSLRGITSDGRLFFGEDLSGTDIYIGARDDKPGAFRMLPRVQTQSNERPVFSRDGRRLTYLAGRQFPLGMFNQSRIRTVDLEGRILRDLPVSREIGAVQRMFFSPQEDFLALEAILAKGGMQILVLSASSGEIVQSIQRSGPFRLNGWSPDGRKLYITEFDQPTGIPSFLALALSSDQTAAIPLTGNNDDRSGAFLSPDGQYVAMRTRSRETSTESYRSGYWVKSLNEGEGRFLKQGLQATVRAPIWDADSRHFFYEARAEKEGDKSPLYRISIESGQQEVFVEDLGELTLAAVSPDGRQLAFTRGVADQRIWVAEHFLPPALVTAPNR